jgi:hypothetical protein
MVVHNIDICSTTRKYLSVCLHLTPVTGKEATNQGQLFEIRTDVDKHLGAIGIQGVCQ